MLNEEYSLCIKVIDLSSHVRDEGDKKVQKKRIKFLLLPVLQIVHIVFLISNVGSENKRKDFPFCD